MKNAIRQFLTDLGLNPNNFTFYKGFIALTIFFMPIFWTIFGIVALVFLDLCTGLIAAYKNKIDITSHRLSKTIYKLLIYVLLLCAGLITDRLMDLKIVVECITFFLASVEILSIGENFQKVTGLSFINYLKTIIASKMKIPEGMTLTEKGVAQIDNTSNSLTHKVKPENDDRDLTDTKL